MRRLAIHAIRNRVERLDRQLNPHDGPDLEELILQTAGHPLPQDRVRRARRLTLEDLVAASRELESIRTAQ